MGGLHLALIYVIYPVCGHLSNPWVLSFAKKELTIKSFTTWGQKYRIPFLNSIIKIIKITMSWDMKSDAG